MVSKKFELKKFELKGKLQEDKVFLLGMIDDPVKTLKNYNINANDEVLAALRAASEDILKRAAEVINEIAGMAADQNCQCCGAPSIRA